MQLVFGFGDLVCGCYYQGEIEIGGGFVQYVWCVVGEDVGCVECVDIQVVVVDVDVGDYLQLCGCCYLGCIDMFVEGDDCVVGVGQLCGDLVW